MSKLAIESLKKTLPDKTARILIYPVIGGARSPREPDAVFPIVVAGGRPDRMTELRSGGNTLSSTLSLPRNVERAYLDVLLFGGHYAGGGWMWWSCAPQGVDVPNLLPPHEGDMQMFGNCNIGTFLEAEISTNLLDRVGPAAFVAGSA